MTRVGILGHGFIKWGGGIDFLRTVLCSLSQAPEPVEIHLLLPTHGPRLAVRNFVLRLYHGARMQQGHSDLSHQHLLELVQTASNNIIVHEIDTGEAAVAKIALKLGLNALIPSISPFSSDFPVPWVGYLYDFQHRYYPEYFHPKECSQRDANFAKMLSRAHSVIVNARTVADDSAKFYPLAHARIFALPFGAAPLPAWFEKDNGESALHRYGINRPYFIVCNQFWKHKDHATLFSAFAKTAENCPDVDLVCTGACDDYRDPDHFPLLIQQLKDKHIRNRVHILGMLPKNDQIALLKRAIGLVQPTLFEGGPGGGAVFDAISLGVPCLVSDITINKEIDEPGIRFFPAGNPEALSLALTTMANNPPILHGSAETLIQRGHERQRRCGEILLQALREATNPTLPKNSIYLK